MACGAKCFRGTSIISWTLKTCLLDARPHSMGVCDSKEPQEGRRGQGMKEKEEGYFTPCPPGWGGGSNCLSHSLSVARRRYRGGEKRSARIEGKVYEDAKRPFRRKTHPNGFGRQDVKRCLFALGGAGSSQDAFWLVVSNHLIPTLCLDPKGAQATKVMNTHEPNAASWTVRQ